MTELPPNAAPGDLELVRAFVNTIDLESGVDAVARPDTLAAWLRERDLLDPGASLEAADVARAAEFREALRELLLATNERAPAPLGALAIVNTAGRRGRLAVNLQPDGSSRLDPHGRGVDAALARLLALVHRAHVDGTWLRLKACRNDTCRWAFYDHSKNRSGAWCSMGVCGSRVKARRYRQRRRDAAEASHDH
ncbi:MAG: zf-CGNR multi-domain protein [Actinomycetota bacterium]|nr:MAG: zf-CGNR multi-domain protein [Actinomycetota bacterium]